MELGILFKLVNKNNDLTKAFDDLKIETDELRRTREAREAAVRQAEEAIQARSEEQGKLEAEVTELKH